MRKTHWLAALLACGLLILRRRDAAATTTKAVEAQPTRRPRKPTRPQGARRSRVGLVSDVGRFNDRSFNQSALEGLTRAEERARRHRPADRVAPDCRLRPEPVFARARQGSISRIAVGFLLAEAINTAATRFTDSNFAIIDYSVKAPPFKSNPNVQGLTFATNENSYMIGCLAGADGRASGRAAGDQRGRRHQAPDGRHLHRRLPGGCEEVQPADQGAGRVLAGLRRAGQVQGGRAEPDRARARRSSSRSRAAAASAPSTPPRSATSGESASTVTSRTSARTSSRARSSGSTSRSS